ncbi:hypothetical protein BDW22DRAFT_1487899 [Trametopsis cervina]|nr:hypothetical protein BDW22DRAFT_1487899 [Trametopsis cervina]
MKTIFKLLTVAAIAASSNALYTIRDIDETDSACANGTVVSNKTTTVNGIDIQFTTFNCAPDAGGLQADFLIFPIPIIPFFPWPIFGWPFFPPPPPPKPPKPTKTTSSSIASPSPSSVNVCNVPCTDSCGHLGDLPPISEDCQQIYDSINITSGSIAPTFDVQSNHIEQLTFGTCRVFFENFSNVTVTYCWSALSSQAQGAGTACFPPVQPVNSAGFCSPSTGAWQVGVAHS